MDETRVGYKTIDILCNMTKDYIDTHIVNNKYIGDIRYLIIYNQLYNYLTKK